MSACEQEELTPRTNARFSVAYIQEIDDSGVEFASNIYDFGSEEITEYGFMYSLKLLPLPDNSEVISQQGKPEKQFVLKAEHSLIKGETYLVVAFIQTTTGRIYSEPQRFVSQGAAGFILEKLEYKEPIFYGDTITVWGSNMSDLSASYSVEFQNKEARVTDVKKESFKFTIPEFYNFNTSGNGPDYFDISIQVLEKKIEMNVNIPFQNAEFQEMETQFIDYGDTIEILGNYLKDANLKIATSIDVPESIYANNVTLEYAGDDKVVFKPNPENAGLHKHLTLEIRGKLYSLGTKVFEYNPTEIDPGQHMLLKPGDYLTIKGSNFNTQAPQIHHGILNGYPIIIYPEASDSESLTFRIGFLNFLFKRTNEFKIKTFEQVSQHAVTFELTNPDLPYMFNPFSPLTSPENWDLGNMASFEGKGFALGNKEIFEIDVENKTVNIVSELQIGANQLRFTFGVVHGENWYLGGGLSDDSNAINHTFFVFNLRTKEIRRLPDLPLNQWIPMLVHAVNGQLYFEGGLEPNTQNDHRLRYKFDIQTEKWFRLPDKEESRRVVGRTIAFEYDGKQLAIGEPTGPGDEGSGLFVFDSAKETWQLLKRLEELGNIGVKTDEVFVIGNKAFLMGSSMFVLNLDTWQLRPVTNLAVPAHLKCNFYRTMAFMAKSNIYVWDCNDNLWEIDLERLEY